MIGRPELEISPNPRRARSGPITLDVRKHGECRFAVTHAWRPSKLSAARIQSGGQYGEHQAPECIRQRLREKNRDHPHSSAGLRRRRQSRGNVSAPSCRSEPHEPTLPKWPGGQRQSMKLAVQAGLRSSTSGGAHPTLLAALLIALGTVGAVFDSASAQTAFTLPAPPFELPMVPSVSGTWTVMVGVGGEYKPDFEGANRAMFSPGPNFSIRRAGYTEEFS